MSRDIEIYDQTDETQVQECDWDLFEEADWDHEVGTQPSEEVKEDEEVDMDLLPYEQADEDVSRLLWEEESVGDHDCEKAMRLGVRLQKLKHLRINVREVRGVRKSVLISYVALACFFDRGLKDPNTDTVAADTAALQVRRYSFRKDAAWPWAHCEPKPKWRTPPKLADVFRI